VDESLQYFPEVGAYEHQSIMTARQKCLSNEYVHNNVGLQGAAKQKQPLNPKCDFLV